MCVLLSKCITPTLLKLVLWEISFTDKFTNFTTDGDKKNNGCDLGAISEGIVDIHMK